MDTKKQKPTKATKAVANVVQSSDAVLSKAAKKNVFFLPVEEFKERYHWYENNRGDGTDMNRVSEIAYDIAFHNTGWMLPAVMVNKITKTVIDGNHSGMAQIQAYEKYGMPTEILVIEVEPIDENGASIGDAKAVQVKNNNQRPWSLENYVKCYINEGNPDYIRLKSMTEELGEFFLDEKGKYHWRYASALRGSSQQGPIREGTYELSKKDMQEQIKLGKEIVEFWTLLGKPKISAWVESFIFAWVKTRAFFGNNLKIERMKKFLASDEGKTWLDATSSTKVWMQRFTSVLVG